MGSELQYWISWVLSSALHRIVNQSPVWLSDMRGKVAELPNLLKLLRAEPGLTPQLKPGSVITHVCMPFAGVCSHCAASSPQPSPGNDH